jgi:tetrapyrrole methylase family protein/MazG family protein
MQEDQYKNESTQFTLLLGILRKLRSPDGGCPWDIRQEKEDIARFLVEEAYELIDAITLGDSAGQCEEIGDLLFQAFFLARISEERGEFCTADVLKGIGEKMVRRHPHVFGDQKVASVQEVKENWEKIKREVEHKSRPEGVLSGIPRSLPSLLRAQKVTEKAAAVGFDWKDIREIAGKVEEELEEFRAALDSKDKDSIREEIGDLLFSLVNLSRFAEVSAEEALMASTDKFLRRFSYIEKKLGDSGKSPGNASLEEMDRLWDEAKREV